MSSPAGDPSAYKALLFDLGGVLYAIDVSRSVNAFQQLMPKDLPDSFPSTDQILQHPIFRQFELGELSPSAFRDALRQAFGFDCRDAVLDEAWNALLLGPIAGRKEFLAELRKEYRLILLSNTNSIHYSTLLPETQPILDTFDSVYLSFEIGLRKPDQAIFDWVMDTEGLKPADLYFVEDSPANLIAAKSLGISGVLVPQNTPDLSIYLFK